MTILSKPTHPVAAMAPQADDERDSTLPGMGAAFVRAARAERDLSPHTLAAYSSDLAQFGEWTSRGGITSVDQIDRRLLRRYVAYLSERRYSDRPEGQHRSVDAALGDAPRVHLGHSGRRSVDSETQSPAAAGP